MKSEKILLPLHPNYNDMWNKLSMADKANIIKLGVESGITDLNIIRKQYNSFARGGYTKWKDEIQRYKGINIDEDNTYDYEGFYNSNPDRAWSMLNEKSDAHFTDEFKTALHPSFSDESIYSGSVNKFNPKGIKGGHWYGNSNYVLSEDQFNNDWDTDETIDYWSREPDVPILHAPNGSRILHSVTVTPQSSALNRSRSAKGPYTDFSNAQDLNDIQRFGANYLPWYVDPHTCLNTVTSFYDETNTVAGNLNMIAHPEDYGYREIQQKDAVPGDIIILSNGKGEGKHAVIFDSVSKGYGSHNGYPINIGDTLVNYSNGGRRPEDYRIQGPLPRFDDREYSGGDFSGPHRYLRYTGKGSKKK